MEVMLILYLIMPSDVPDKQHTIPMKSMEECWTKAQKFTSGDPKDAGAVGLGAGCVWKKEGSNL